MSDDKKKAQERVKVGVRVRPLTEEDLRFSNKDTIIEELNLRSGSLIIKKDSEKKNFNFDTLFDESISQKEIYLKVGRPVVESVLKGYNSTILAYGQTGTGKTHTMIGTTGKQRGIIPRCVKEIFSANKKDEKHSYSVKVGFMQLYMEVLQDLIKPNPTNPIQIREDPDEGIFLSGLSWMDASNVEDCMNYLAIGDKNRSVAFTNMNAQSSRSHAVFMVKVERRAKFNVSSKSKKSDNKMTKSTLYLVDLAGSERVSKTKISGNRLDEAKNINLSLLALGNVIHALSDGKAKYIPFRDSKLTRILEQSFGGNSKTSMIVTIGPSPVNFHESVSSLLFATRAMKIQNIPKQNVDIDYKGMVAKLQAEIDKINDTKNISTIEFDRLNEENSMLKEKLEKITMDKEKADNDKAKLERLLEGCKQGLDLSMVLGDSDECEQLKVHYRKKLESKEEELRKLSQKFEQLVSEKDEKIMNLEAKINELETINSSLSMEFKRLQEEFDKEKIDKDRLITELYELREKEFDRDVFDQEIIRIIGSSNSSMKSGYGNTSIISKSRGPMTNIDMIDIDDIKKRFPIEKKEFSSSAHGKDDLEQMVKKYKDIVENLEDALIDTVEKLKCEHMKHNEDVLTLENEKKDLKNNMAKLIKAYKRLEAKTREPSKKKVGFAN